MVFSMEPQMNNKAVAMGDSGLMERIVRLGSILLLAAALVSPADSQAQVNRVTTVKDEKGWRLKVDGENYYIKGVVWGYSPRGQNYTYNLWGETDDFIRKVLDYEMGLMKAAGINTIRTFSMVPPEWIAYIYREHGIMSVVNPLMGRYGYTVDGEWVPFTDYSDPKTREVLIRDMTAIVEQYRNTPGVLMFAFGNESNYGLSWSSFEIENLPEGEQNTAKARYLYSLWNEVIIAGKAVAPDHLFTIVNGDIQYIDLIAELVTDMDLLGSNAYRGPGFTSLWADVEKKLDLPVVFFEFGSDAFNARSFQEDQVSQALILKEQWQEMYNKAWGNGEEGNSIGAFIFEWRDEWWKYLQIENLDVQDTNASWSNQAYLFDWAPGKNNMNEEWFGITALGTRNSEGIYEARPRMAYDVISEVFAMDPYAASKGDINEMFSRMNLEFYALQGDVRQIKAENAEQKKKLQLTGGNIYAEFAFLGTEESVRVNGKDGTDFTDGQMIFVDFAFNPTENIEGQFSLNVLGNVARKQPLMFSYPDRGLPTLIDAPPVVPPGTPPDQVPPTTILEDSERIEIYDFNTKYEGENLDVEAFYHTPRFHWGYEGDFFNLVQEATDIIGIDVWNGKAPKGVEFAGKGKYGGLKLVAGSEIYWGANPQWTFKYDFKFRKTDFTFIHQEEVSRLGEGANATAPTNRVASKTTLFADMDITQKVKLEVGGIISSRERLDDVYDYVDDQGNIKTDQIDFEDMLGLKARITFPILGHDTYFSAHTAGLVGDGGNPIPTFGVTDPTRLPYNGLGNKNEFEAGMRIYTGNWLIYPRFLYRENLIGANPLIEPSIDPDGTLNQGTAPRNRDDDPFAVLGNREARSGEIYFTWDPTGATPFYDWDNEWREDAPFAFNFGGTYTRFPTATDSNLFFLPIAGGNVPFGRGLPAEDVWSLSSRMVFNLGRSRYILNLVRGFDQSTGDPEGGSRKFFDISGKAFLGGKHLVSGYIKKDAWGPYDFQRQFNTTFPEQYQLEYAYLLNGFSSIRSIVDEVFATQIGFRLIYRTLDENSGDDLFLTDTGINDYDFLALIFASYRF
jgi:hypothetical protein